MQIEKNNQYTQREDLSFGIEKCSKSAFFLFTLNSFGILNANSKERTNILKREGLEFGIGDLRNASSFYSR
jgi:hypothetical protein